MIGHDRNVSDIDMRCNALCLLTPYYYLRYVLRGLKRKKEKEGRRTLNTRFVR